MTSKVRARQALVNRAVFDMNQESNEPDRYNGAAYITDRIDAAMEHLREARRYYVRRRRQEQL